ncbi:MAG TPA: BolA family transcriptional regulator [Alphaproteobacteria bacterium]|nr:BolA family transcriptional regulator [Alphaproteobacteria bacterium]
MSVARTIERKLTEQLHPQSVDVLDQSHQHAGHASAPPGGESHFHVEIVAEAFNNLNRVARQRLVYQILNDELAGPVHALSLNTLTPAEAITKPYSNGGHNRK